MRDLPTAFLLIFLLMSMFSCQTQVSDKKDKPKVKPEVRLETSMTNVDTSLRALTELESKTNIASLDSLLLPLKQGPKVEQIIKKDYCWGDCCGAYKLIINKDVSAKMYLFKTECYDYGFGNDQFYFRNDSLKIVRNFNYGIEEFGNEKRPTVFYVEEQLFFFDSVKVVIRERRKKLSHPNDLNLSGFAFKERIGDEAIIRKQKLKELNSLTELDKPED